MERAVLLGTVGNFSKMAQIEFLKDPLKIDRVKVSYSCRERKSR
jgi:hypothetical protein